jgi:hypothetical protein
MRFLRHRKSGNFCIESGGIYLVEAAHGMTHKCHVRDIIESICQSKNLLFSYDSRKVLQRHIRSRNTIFSSIIWGMLNENRKWVSLQQFSICSIDKHFRNQSTSFTQTSPPKFMITTVKDAIGLLFLMHQHSPFHPGLCRSSTKIRISENQPIYL